MSLFPFDTAFYNLNSKQKDAVMHTEGPVMVIAGPGTGKTQILSVRIGNILRNAHVLAENILCLTYTEAGVVAMRERLRDLIGQDANKVKISTFHSFCNELILTNPEVFPDFEEKTLLDELTQIKILRKIIDEQPYGHPLKSPNAPYTHIKNFKSLIEILNRESISLTELHQAIEKEKEAAKTKDEFIYQRNSGANKKGDLKTKPYQDYCQQLEKTYQVALCIERYHQLLKQHNLYTFDDMVSEVLHAFETNSDFLANCQEQFIYILVDEYQDTNGAQQKILNYLTESWGEEANIFVVGDEDQSIFRFQGANMENITEFIDKYFDNLKTIVLEDNYRSTQNILRAAYTVVEENEQRLEKKNNLFKKNLTARKQPLDYKPILIEIDNARLEDAFVIHEIQRIQHENPKLPLSEIAVIALKNSDLENIAHALKQIGIPYKIRKDIDILEHSLIQQILNILHYLNPALKGLQAREDLLFKILMSVVWQTDWTDIQKLFFMKHIDLQEKDIPKIPTLEYLNSPALLQGLGIENYMQIHSITEKIKYWKWCVYAMPIMEVVKNVIYESGFLNYATQHQDKEELLLILDTFYHHIYQWTKRNPKKDFKDLLSELKEYNDFEIPLTINRWFGNDKGVFLSTYHSAKGLEFEHVYLIKCDEKSWRKKNQIGFKLPPNLIEKSQNKTDELEEQRRLFFVGMTRAKKHLNLVYAKKNELHKPQSANMFYQLLEKHVPDIVDKKTVDLETETLLTQISNQFKTSVLPVPNLSVSKDIIAFYQQNFELSASHINTYLNCKRKFYYKHVLRIPTEPHHAIVYGNAIHAACNRFLITYQETKTLPDAEYLKNQFESILYEQKFMLTEQEYQDRLEQGKAELTLFYGHYHTFWEQTSFILPEQYLQTDFLYSVQDVHRKIPLNGTADKLLHTDNTYTLIDYKTGRPDNISSKIKPYEGDYWRQILFYLYLLEQNNYTVDKAKIYFFSPSKEENSQEAEVFIMDSHREQLQKDLKETINGILQGNFECVDILEVDKKCKECAFKDLCWKHESAESEGRNENTTTINP
jgi:DNA helicase-2/ATP-dependent DNA helicase PcrA